MVSFMEGHTNALPPCPKRCSGRPAYLQYIRYRKLEQAKREGWAFAPSSKAKAFIFSGARLMVMLAVRNARVDGDADAKGLP